MSAEHTDRPTVGLVMPLATQRGGAEALLQRLLRARSAQVAYRCLFLEDGPLVEEVRGLGCETAVLPATQLRDLLNYVQVVRGVRRWIAHTKPDVLVSWMLKGHLYAAPASLGRPMPCVWFQHGIARRHWMDLAGAWLPASAIFCCSDFVRQAQSTRSPRRRSLLCHPGVMPQGTDAPTREQARHQLALPKGAELVVMVARLERWKGAHVLLEAASLLRARRPQTVFAVIGGEQPFDRAYAKELRQRARMLALGDRFRLLGQRPAGEVPLWHASADVVAHPGAGPEPFGMAVVEAMAAGRAVIASRAGGIPEIIEDGRSGLLIRPGDARDLADTIERLLADTAWRARMERQARERAAHFCTSAFAQRFESLVCSVLEAHRSAA